MVKDRFTEEYKKLNKAQKEAVDRIDGPVMVVAGPGTGKTHVLSLRIANILKKTDIKADGVLCLTFTNSGVDAMRERLHRYIGQEGDRVNVFTFHSFGMKIIEEHFGVLGLPASPKLLLDTDRAIFFDRILNENDWEYLRPRSDGMRYFEDLKSIISLFKRERVGREDFESAVEKEIKFLKNDEGSISTRGESKGELKKEVLKEIEGLERSLEIAEFLRLYDEAKKENNLLDYDDVLEALVKIVELSLEAASLIRERYLYILVDEHQDSSRVQNEFLSRVWASVERPDIFVVGDDRQLIYGFSGASIEHFTGFKKTFPDAELITLTDNYRSTQIILDASHALLESVLSGKKLKSHGKEGPQIGIREGSTPEEEIIAVALDIKEKIKEGLDPDDCAILVPKNRQVRRALEILHRQGVPVSTLDALHLFDQEEMQALLRVLKIINNGDPASLALSFLDRTSGVGPREAYDFFISQNMRGFSLNKLLGEPPALFSSFPNVDKWILKLAKWKNDSGNKDLKSLLETIGEELFEGEGTEGGLVSGKEILDTVLGIYDSQVEKLARPKSGNPDIRLEEFVLYLGKAESFGEHVPLVAREQKGVKVLTMHSSKGLEFDYVWIAHMDERSLSGGKKSGFALPESIAEKIEERDIDAIKRKLYVAITRAKRFCTLSYSCLSVKGGEQELAKVIAELPKEVFKKEKIEISRENISHRDLSGTIKMAKDKYKDRYVSVSLLNNFFECPRKWFFENLLQLPKDKVEVLEFGIAVHASIDRILKMENIPAREDVENIVTEEVLRREFGGPRERLKMGREIINIVLSWVKNRLPEIKPSRKTEESLSLHHSDFPHLKIYGKIDLIENLRGNTVRVTDFKTGGMRKKSEIEKRDDEGRMSGNLRQLAMYSYLLEKNPKWGVAVKESRLEFLEAKNPKESIYERTIGEEEIKLLKKDITDYDALLKSGEWIARECRYNSYGKNTECEYCKMAEMHADL